MTGVWTVVHAPEPSHTWPCTDAPTQVVAPHAVPSGAAFAHAPAPSHAPVAPHAVVPGSHSSSGSLLAGTGVHAPSG